MMSIVFILFSLIVCDTDFAKLLLGYDENDWQPLLDTDTPSVHDIETFSLLAHRLAHWIPGSFLQSNTRRLEGKIISVTKLRNIYRCKMILDEQSVDIFVPAIPADWPLDWQLGKPMNERAAAFGVYIKTHHDIPVFVAPAIEWFPDSYLGHRGFNAASFDGVPIRRVVEIESHDDETNYRTFAFTESDIAPFYGLLRAMSAVNKNNFVCGSLSQTAMDAKETVRIIDLFNRPEETRGIPILLHGTAKRIIPTPVVDSEVHTLFGIKHYYQIYLYPEESRGNPIVVCVPSLPVGMPTGDERDFSEVVSITAVLYKLWIYNTSSGRHYAPVLIGQTPVWHPDNTDYNTSGTRIFSSISFTVFLVLVLIWFACRVYVRRFKQNLYVDILSPDRYDESDTTVIKQQSHGHSQSRKKSQRNKRW